MSASPAPKLVTSSTVPSAALSEAGWRSDFDSWWRDKRLFYNEFLKTPVVEINDPTALSAVEHADLSARIDAANMALYRIKTPRLLNSSDISSLAAQFGLREIEANHCANDQGVSEIRVSKTTGGSRYIPYTNHALNWHTDGYYNDLENAIGAFVLHCNSPAWSGGENRLLDHELLYGILATDSNVKIGELFRHDAFSVPANIEDGKAIRPETAGPVFFSREEGLGMRYSARKRNIHWRQSSDMLLALEAIRYYLGNRPEVLTVQMKAGMGVICRNVLHSRSAFVDGHGKRRELLRARYTDTIDQHHLSADKHALVE